MKEAIAQGAIEELLVQGLKFTIRDVASRLGMSTKTIYSYFESKEHIISHIVDKTVEEMKVAERGIMDDPSLSIHQKMIEALVVFPRKFAYLDLRIIQGLRQRYPEQWRKLDEHIQYGWENIRLLAKEGVLEGSFRAFDMELFIQAYIGALYHIMDSQVAGKIELTLEKTLEQLVELLMVGIANPPREDVS